MNAEKLIVSEVVEKFCKKCWLTFLDDLRTFRLSAENQITVNLIDMDQFLNSSVSL